MEFEIYTILEEYSATVFNSCFDSTGQMLKGMKGFPYRMLKWVTTLAVQEATHTSKPHIRSRDIFRSADCATGTW